MVDTSLYEFIDAIGHAAQSYYAEYQILPSLCIAQALLESNKADYRKGLLSLSGLAKDCHNYFGMKWSEGCGCDYKEYRTGEQKKTGEYYTISAKFRKYKSLEDGVRGYFQFLQYKRYANLRGVTDYKVACNLIRQDGWATSLTYTENLIKRIESLQLYRYDPIVSVIKNQLEYYPACSPYMSTMVAALASVGETDTTLEHRKKIGAANGITGVGSSSANNKMLELLKQGKLKKA